MLAKNAMIKKICLHFLGKTQNKICFINTKSKNRLIKEISIPTFLARKPLTAIRKQTSQKRKKPVQKKKGLEIYSYPTFLGEKPLTAIKTNKQVKKKKKKKKEKKPVKQKKMEELGVVRVAILTEAFKLLHLQVPNIANIK